MGLILIFGAYLLLKTINPALVNLQPLNIRAVKTEIIALPWCEDLTGQGTPTPVQGLQTCGAVGEYRPSSSAESVFPCIYRGSAPVIAKQADFRAGALAEQALGAPARQDGPTNGMTDERLIHTCMQRGGLDQQSLLATARADQAYRAAMTLPCAALTAPVAKAMGYPELNGACKAWQDATTAFQTVDNPRQNAQKNYDGVIWSYCAKSTVNDTCVQSDAYCHKVDNNNDDGARGGCEEEDDCGCQGYDESPSVAFTEKKDILEGDPGSGTTWVTGSYETITVEDSGPEDFPSHLGPICAWNPCKDYVGPNGKKNFANGCSGPNISTYVWGVRAVTADCRNK